MIKSHRSFALLLLGLLAVHLFDLSTAKAEPRAKHIFIISLDQGNADLIRTNDLPTFNTMAAEQAHTWNAYTIVPSVTLPSHTSMLTGVGPQVHQVLWNSYLPTNGLVKVPTIFSLAKERGLVTAMFVGKEKFKHLVLTNSVDVFVWPQPDDDAISVAKAFASQVSQLKPNLCFIHFRDADTVGHTVGAYAPEKVKALKDCDDALKIVKEAITSAGLMNDSVIILTADHGSHDSKDKNGKIIATHGDARPEDVLIPWVAWGKGVKKKFTITAPVVQYDTAATALWLLDLPVPENFWGRPVSSAFK